MGGGQRRLDRTKKKEKKMSSNIHARAKPMRVYTYAITNGLKKEEDEN
jgi:hypothetical protein